jgi:hypothetical protein
MKKYITALLVIFGMATFISANGTEAPANRKKSQEEIEIMKGILNTTISYTVRNLNQQEKTTTSTAATSAFVRTIREPKIHDFRLAGQGVVFVIPMTSLSISDSSVFVENFGEDLSGRMEGFASRTANLQAALAQESPWASNKAPADQDPSAQKREEARKKKAEELQAQIQKRREENQAKMEKFLQNITEIKSHMIETIANYGDSFTTIKPDEYINIILTQGDGFTIDVGPFPFQAISIKRSWITDYKAGKLTLDTFKQKVLSYIE